MTASRTGHDADSASGSMTEGHLPNTQNFYKVRREDLPVHCPMPGSTLWNSHPRVYLPVERTGQAKCIYCGAEYVLDTTPQED